MLKKQFLLLLTLMFSIAVIAVADEAYSKNWGNRALKKTIEKRYHHLGDDYIGGFVVQEPEGTYWETNFWLPKSVFNHKEIAFVKFLAHDIDSSGLIINGHWRTLFKVEEGTTQLFHHYMIRIPFNILREGENLIGFEVNCSGGGCDDIEFGELEIWFQ